MFIKKKYSDKGPRHLDCSPIASLSNIIPFCRINQRSSILVKNNDNKSSNREVSSSQISSPRAMLYLGESRQLISHVSQPSTKKYLYLANTTIWIHVHMQKTKNKWIMVPDLFTDYRQHKRPAVSSMSISRVLSIQLSPPAQVWWHMDSNQGESLFRKSSRTLSRESYKQKTVLSKEQQRRVVVHRLKIRGKVPGSWIEQTRGRGNQESIFGCSQLWELKRLCAHT